MSGFSGIPFGASIVLYRLIGADMNSTADQPLVKLHSYSYFSIMQIMVMNASISLTTAAGGFYSAAAKGGTAYVAASQVYTTLNASSKGLLMTLVQPDTTGRLTADPILSLTTPQGAAATADIYVVGFGVL